LAAAKAHKPFNDGMSKKQRHMPRKADDSELKVDELIDEWCLHPHSSLPDLKVGRGYFEADYLDPTLWSKEAMLTVLRDALEKGIGCDSTIEEAIESKDENFMSQVIWNELLPSTVLLSLEYESWGAPISWNFSLWAVRLDKYVIPYWDFWEAISDWPDQIAVVGVVYPASNDKILGKFVRWIFSELPTRHGRVEQFSAQFRAPSTVGFLEKHFDYEEILQGVLKRIGDGYGEAVLNETRHLCQWAQKKLPRSLKGPIDNILSDLKSEETAKTLAELYVELAVSEGGKLTWYP
jgi:hypothetical protein